MHPPRQYTHYSFVDFHEILNILALDIASFPDHVVWDSRLSVTLFISEDSFHKLEVSTVPEMQRSNLSPVILQLKALGIDNVLRFHFLSVSDSVSYCRLVMTVHHVGRGSVWTRLWNSF